MVIQIKSVSLTILQNFHFRRVQPVSFPCSTISDLSLVLSKICVFEILFLLSKWGWNCTYFQLGSQMSAWIFKRNTKTAHFMLWIYGKSWYFADEFSKWRLNLWSYQKAVFGSFSLWRSTLGFFIWLPDVKKDFLYNPLRLETQITPVYCTNFAKASLNYSPHFEQSFLFEWRQI